MANYTHYTKAPYLARTDTNCFCHLSPQEFKVWAARILYKKFAQLLPTGPDNQFINISNPDPFTLLKLISTKYVFSQITFTNSYPYPIFLPAKYNQARSIKMERGHPRSWLDEEARPSKDLAGWRSAAIQGAGWMKECGHPRTWLDEGASPHQCSTFQIQIFRSAGPIFVLGKFKTQPRGVKLSFWLTAVSIFNSICEPMNI